MSKTPINGRNTTLTLAEVLELPAAVDLVTAGRAFGISRTKAHELVRANDFPCRVLRLGNQYRVPTAEILRLLGLDGAIAQFLGLNDAVTQQIHQVGPHQPAQVQPPSRSATAIPTTGQAVQTA